MFEWYSPEVTYYIVAVFLLVLNVGFWLLNMLTLPGNWMVLASTAIFVWLYPYPQETGGLHWWLIGGMLVLASLGELVEFAAGAVGAAKQGASRRAMVLAVVGTICGSLLGAGAGIPIPIVGPVIGALGGGALGAFSGAWVGETWKGKTAQESYNVSKGAMVGRILGTIGKLLCGSMMLALMIIDLIF
ncbi:hypothetical protein Pla110_38060 [Polystyrenella longa]|uniref:DUF456 domain-containing protein n=1 Tax=Polystyrenella longa TaxID=2528007 RepID=A0A518CS36_9PLAN|nr:DUF456 domain-containing protein [Polystyrenella longa]QDU82051.1 hypothetical protein Pla110_38060 [Polystyrenella longa]